MHSFNPRPWGAGEEAGESFEFEAGLVYVIQGQSEVHSGTCLKKPKGRKFYILVLEIASSLHQIAWIYIYIYPKIIKDNWKKLILKEKLQGLNSLKYKKEKKKYAKVEVKWIVYITEGSKI